MKIFDDPKSWDTKVNFVDENNVVLGYDMSASCCEEFGWFIKDKPSTERPEADNHILEGMEGYVFDPDFFMGETIDPDDYPESDEHIVIFRITDGTNEKFIHLYNMHNGYYSHNFHLDVKGETIKEGDL